MFWFGLVSLFNGISTLFRLFNAKAILLEEQLRYSLTHSWEDKGVHTFPKGICPKVNVIARLEYELAYYDSAVHRFNHYTTRTPPLYVLCNCFVRLFCTRFYQICMNFKQIYLSIGRTWIGNTRSAKVDLIAMEFPNFQNWRFTNRCSLVSYSGHYYFLRGDGDLIPFSAYTKQVIQSSPDGAEIIKLLVEDIWILENNFHFTNGYATSQFYSLSFLLQNIRGIFCRVAVNVLDSSIDISEFDLQ